jgi:hypothetical protein
MMESDYEMEEQAFEALAAMVEGGHAIQASIMERDIRRMNIEHMAELEEWRTRCECTLRKCAELRLKINAALAAQSN